MHRLRTVLASSALMLVSELQAGAQQADGTSVKFGQPSTGFTNGVWAVAGKTCWDNSFKTNFVSYLHYKSNDVTIGFSGWASYQFLSNYNLSACVEIKSHIAPLDEGDKSALRGMKRNFSFDPSFNAVPDITRGSSVLIEAATELTGEYDRQEFDLALRQFILGLGTHIFLTAGVKRQNEKLSPLL